MIYSGLDWSGNPGDATKSPHENSWFVVALCHVDGNDMETLAAAFVQLRASLKLRNNHVFKHQHSVERTRRAFFEMIAPLPVTATVLAIDKRNWDATYLARSTGPQRVYDAIVDLVLHCGVATVAGQHLLVDMHRAEPDFIRNVKLTLRRSLHGQRRANFKNVKARPDHRGDSAIIQLADLIAGDIRANAGTPSVLLHGASRKLKVIKR